MMDLFSSPNRNDKVSPFHYKNKNIEVKCSAPDTFLE